MNKKFFNQQLLFDFFNIFEIGVFESILFCFNLSLVSETLLLFCTEVFKISLDSFKSLGIALELKSLTVKVLIALLVFFSLFSKRQISKKFKMLKIIILNLLNKKFKIKFFIIFNIYSLVFYQFPINQFLLEHNCWLDYYLSY